MKNYGNDDYIELKKDGLHYIIARYGRVMPSDDYRWDTWRVENDDWVFCGYIYTKSRRTSYKKLWELVINTER